VAAADEARRSAAKPDRPLLVVVTGLPASGKSSVARRLAKRLALPLFSKDTFKERIYDALGGAPAAATPDATRAFSRRLSRASNAVLFELARAQLRARQPLVLESNFDRERDSQPLRDVLGASRAACVQVVCRCAPELALERFRERIARGERHACHDDAAFLPELEARTRAGDVAPLDLAGACIEYDTTRFDEASRAALARAVDEAARANA